MQKQKIFDAHHHLWDLTHCRYPWLMARDERRFFGDPAPIQKNYLLDDLLTDAAAYDLVGSTHIQVGVAEGDAVKETLWLQNLATATPDLPKAIVGFVDLRKDNLSDCLKSHQTAERFRGVRQIVGRHPDEDAKTGSDRLLDDPRFLHGLKILETNSVSFDLQLIETQYERAFRLLENVPGLCVAICHFASPWDLSSDGFHKWRAAMTQFATLPNVSIKFSGFGMFKPNWSAADITPYVETALELFGSARCMAGSNFPVDKLYGGYDRIWRVLKEIIAEENIYQRVVLENAIRFYKVDT